MQTNKTKITNIISQRKPLVEKINYIRNNLNLLTSKLHELINYRDEVLSKKGHDTELINLDSLLKQINETNRDLIKLRNRFDRDTLNIGIIGRARQGKSRLLRSLTGLPQSVIPDGSGSHCTGVRSTIYHKPDITTYADVIFHTEDSFLCEIIKPYYEAIELKAPNNLLEFQHGILPKITGGSAEKNAQLNHLKKYKSSLEDYQEWLSYSSPYRVEENNIPKFVAQYNPITQESYSNYRAVKEVKIYCSFPNEDIGKIALVDMPGLGDTGAGDSERLIETLGQDVDMIAFVRMPKATGDHWADHDVALYDTAAKALKEIPIEQWSCMVLNQLADNSNIANCSDLKNTVQEHHIKVSQLLQANCSDNEETNRLVLEPVLEYMVSHISLLDQQYALSYQQKLNNISVLVTEAHLALRTAYGSSNQFDTFQKCFDDFWGELTKGIETLLAQLATERNKPDINLENALEKVLVSSASNENLPSEEEVEYLSSTKYSKSAAYIIYLDWLRARLTKHFQGLDDGLDESVEQMKVRLASILRKTGLQNLNNETGTAFLEVFYKTEISTWDNAKNIQQGFKELTEFSLRYKTLIHHRIRQHLDTLSPDITKFKLNDDASAKDVVSRLETAYFEARYHIEGAIKEGNILCEPNMAIFAVLEEFRDQTIIAKGSEKEWARNLHEIKERIWPQEFKLQSLLDEIKQASTVDKFSFY